jgi:hypothetical protein
MRKVVREAITVPVTDGAAKAVAMQDIPMSGCPVIAAIDKTNRLRTPVILEPV